MDLSSRLNSCSRVLWTYHDAFLFYNVTVLVSRGVFLYASILIILAPAELPTKKPFRYGYMGLATCSMITGMGYLYYLGFIILHEFPYTKKFRTLGCC